MKYNLSIVSYCLQPRSFDSNPRRRK